jgi:hypothetical protein
MSFFFFFFSYTKAESRRTEQVLPGGLVPEGWGRSWGRGEGGWIWYKYCIHMYVNGKMKSVETIPGMGRG